MTILDDVAKGRAERSLDPPEGEEVEKNKDDYCQECGVYTPHMSGVETCIDHLNGVYEVTQYAEGLRECLNKLGEANTVLSKKNLDLNNKFYTLLEKARGHNVSNQIANVQMAGFLAKFKEDGE
jgi:hypothetical protein